PDRRGAPDDLVVRQASLAVELAGKRQTGPRLDKSSPQAGRVEHAAAPKLDRGCRTCQTCLQSGASRGAANLKRAAPSSEEAAAGKDTEHCDVTAPKSVLPIPTLAPLEGRRCAQVLDRHRLTKQAGPQRVPVTALNQRQRVVCEVRATCCEG